MEDMPRLEEEAEEEHQEADAEVDPAQVPEEDAGEMDAGEDDEEDVEPTEELQLPVESMAQLEMYKAMIGQGLFRPVNRSESDEEDESYHPQGPDEEDPEDEDDGMDMPSMFHRQFRRYNQRRLKQEGWNLVYGLLKFKPEDPASAGHLSRIEELMLRRPKALLFLDGLKRSVLHLALLRRRSDLVKMLLSFEDDPQFAELAMRSYQGGGEKDKDLVPCLHLAMSGIHLEHAAASSLQCLQLLLDLPYPLVQQVDNTGRNALHVACYFGSAAAVQMLLAKGADAGLHDDHGLLPLHYAIDSRSVLCVQAILQASDQSLFQGELNPFYRCIERQAWEVALLLHKQNWNMGDEAEIDRIFGFARERGLDKEWEFVCEKGLEGASAMEEVVWTAEVFKEPGTVLVTHPICTGHRAIPKEADDPEVRLALMSRIPENPHRLEVLVGPDGVLRADFFRELRWIPEAAPAALVDVLRVHEFWYVKKLMDKVQEARGMDSRQLPLDRGDTKVSEESWSAAIRAAGAVLEAVDQVCNETARNAFCCVRPPGHHLGPAGAVDNQDLMDDPEGSQGFCLLNNVAIGAAYARCVYRHLIHKVAIIDFDVHHGNGTEAVVKNMRPRPDVPPEKSAAYFHAGHLMRIHHVPAPSCKPWLDPETDVESVFFASIHGFGGGFYPGTGKSSESSQPRIINVALRKRSGPVEFRRGLRQRILPALQEFGPDLIFISAGFDGHEDDIIGCCGLSEEDYVWATQQLMAVANRCCQGRLISVLEGGYNTRAEALSPFAAAVTAHVRTLMFTSQNYNYLDYEADAVPGDGERTQAEVAENFRAIRREEAKRLRRKRGRPFGEGRRHAKKAKLEEEKDEEKAKLEEEKDEEKAEKTEEKAVAEAAPESSVASPPEAPDMFMEDAFGPAFTETGEEASSLAEAPEASEAADDAAEAPASDVPGTEAPEEAAEPEEPATSMELEREDPGVSSSAEALPPAEEAQREQMAEISLPPAEDPPREQMETIERSISVAPSGDGDEEEAQLDDAERVLKESVGLLKQVGAEKPLAEELPVPENEELDEAFEEEESEFLTDVVQ